jgi:Mce-associated membrane protein
VSTGGPHTGRNLVLGLLVLLLALACTTGALAVRRTHDDREAAADAQHRYAVVLGAATAEAKAFVNISFRDARSSIDAVAAGATGRFRAQYDASSPGVLRVLRQHRSVLDGRVVSAGVVDLGTDSATVVAATSGTVSNVRTHDQPVARDFRLRLDLVRVGGRWLTSDVEVVD